ncbi:MAG: DUF1295 domain-containing protein [Acidimicrobiia bacterium]|nr:DUF1295 domain-containing protein [Acidimicrobiia bacterium]
MAGRWRSSKGLSLAVLGGVYAVALGVGLLVAEASRGIGPLAAALLGDLAATGVVFLFAVLLDNTSVYDPYWSLVPLPLALWWYFHPGEAGAADPWRFGLMAAVLGMWGVRLTANFARGWTGLNHEDWRYATYRRLGRARYWLISLAGLQMMPTLMVFGAMLPVYAVTRQPGPGPNLLDGLAVGVALGALVLEAVADEQKRRQKAVAVPGTLVASGLWERARHPNYLGEVAFWWGLFAFAPAAAWSHSWTVVGAVAMTLLFWRISVPLMDRHMQSHYPGYQAFAAGLPAMVPLGRRGRQPEPASRPVADG